MRRLAKRVNINIKKYRRFRVRAEQTTNKYDSQKMMREYANCLDRMKIDSNLVLYESYWGRGLVDSPKAIFDYLVRKPEFSQLKHVWVVENKEVLESAREQYGHLQNVFFVEMESAKYYEYLASAKYLINNIGFRPYFVKRTGQVYINTWHGTPLKSMGYYTVDGSVGVGNIVRNYLSADYLISANKIMTDMYLKDCKMEGILPGEIIEEGYPRNDILFSAELEDVRRSLNKKGVVPDDNRITVLYAPTWRNSQVGAGADAANSLLEEFSELKKALPEDIYQVLVKPHQIVFNELKRSKDIKDIEKDLIPSSVDINELMCFTDILVTDYSSVFFDYLCTNRPILFYIPDADAYSNERGELKLTLDRLPGQICNTMREVADSVELIKKGSYTCDRVEAMRKIICEHEDGNASGKIVDIVFCNNKNGKTIVTSKTDKKKLLINAGEFRENGITHALLSLVNTIDYNDWDVTVYALFNRNNDNLKKRINEDINQNARVLVRVGSVVNTERQEALRSFLHSKTMNLKIWETLYPKEVYKREFARCFGNAEFDYIVDFNGFSRDYVSIFAEGNCKKRSIWMHSDMLSERERTVNGKKPLKEALRFIASRYKDYDNLVSCGKTVMEINKKNLSTKETADKFKYVNNAVNNERIWEALGRGEYITIDSKSYFVADEPETESDLFSTRLIPLPKEDEDAFVTMGRLSTEKNQGNLIEGFRRYNSNHPDSILYIIGDGPLRDNLNEQIKASSMEEKVIMTGNLSNPFSLMKKCDCFILPSLYEGNPMVFHEARACKLSIIASNFRTVSDVCLPGGQLLVGNEAEDYCYGMCEYKKGNIPAVEEDIDAYNKDVYKQFINAIM